MGISKPYYRIARPKAYIPNYVTDHRYASDRLQLSRAYINIEPSEANKSVFLLNYIVCYYGLVLKSN